MVRIAKLTLAIFSILIAIICPSSVSAADYPTIMVSIKPFYNLCAKVMQNVGEPQLLLKNNASPHDYQLKPSEVKLIDSADLVIWGGPELEGFLQKPIANAAQTKNLNLSTIPSLKLLPLRTSTNWAEHTHSHAAEEHDHDHDHGNHHSHAHDVNDAHFWLSPDNAILIANAIAKQLSEMDPAHAAIYIKNSQDFAKEIRAKKPEWKQQLSSVKTTPFIVFHDAYQYFDAYFGLNCVGSISLNPEIPPSAQRIQQIQELLIQQKVRCIFSEPQFNNKIIETLTNGMQIHTGVLDPLGQDADIGPNGYIILINNLVAALAGCK